ncbi:MAG: ArsA family ATPase [Bdellovibrionota bacterium]
MKPAFLRDKKMVICCGTGGVGKTTTSAALALAAALHGKRVGLITIDPAKRLATSLGLDRLKSDPQPLDKYVESALGKGKLKGSLSALMLDSENTFYRFLKEVGGAEIHAKFRDSALFEVIAGNFGGAHDYLAMEKLYELHNSGRFDLLVLDTPPARHTLDFLDAPELIARFFDDRIFAWFLTDPRSSGIAEKLRAKGARVALGVLEKLTGEGVINDFVSLAPHIYKVKNAFVERQRQIRTLLTSHQAGTVFVSSPTDLSRGEARPFLKDAQAKGIDILAFVVNRSLRELAPEAEPRGLKTAPAPVAENYRRLRFLVEEEEKNLRLLKELASSRPVLTAPELEEDVHDLPGLLALAEILS